MILFAVLSMSTFGSADTSKTLEFIGKLSITAFSLREAAYFTGPRL